MLHVLKGFKAIYIYEKIMTQIRTMEEKYLNGKPARQSKSYCRTNHQKLNENRCTASPTNSIHTRSACSPFSMQSSMADGGTIETSNITKRNSGLEWMEITEPPSESTVQ